MHVTSAFLMQTCWELLRLTKKSLKTVGQLSSSTRSRMLSTSWSWNECEGEVKWKGVQYDGTTWATTWTRTRRFRESEEPTCLRTSRKGNTYDRSVVCTDVRGRCQRELDNSSAWTWERPNVGATTVQRQRDAITAQREVQCVDVRHSDSMFIYI